MIQPASIHNNRLSRANKLTEKDGETESSFDALLQNIGQQQKTDEDPLEAYNQQLPLQQDLLFYQLGAVEYNMLDQPQKPVQQQIAVSSPTNAKTGEIEADAVIQLPDINLVQDQGGDPGQANKHVNQTNGNYLNAALLVSGEKQTVSDENFKVISEDSNENRPISEIATTEVVPIIHQQAEHLVGAERTKPPTDTVRATHFDQDVSGFIQSAVNVKGSDAGVEAAFTLTPKHLGKVEVKVTIQDGHVTAEFLTSTPLGKDLLETHVQTLRSALEIQGLQVNKIDISQQTANSASFLGSFAQQGDSQGKHGQHDSRKRSALGQLAKQEDYPDYSIDTGSNSKINTTA